MADLGQWAPDLPEYGHDGLVIARNCYPSILGYEPIRSLTAVTASLPATWTGGGWFEGAGGNTALLAATAAALYTLTATTANSVHTVATSQPWYFVQFGDLAIGVNGGAPVKFTLTSGTAANLGGSPPAASYAAIVRDFVILAGNSTNQNRYWNSAINNAEGWTAGTGQADQADIPDGGPITGLAGGEFGLIFQEEAITLLEYTGGATVFQARKVVRGVGAVSHGSIAQHGRRCFFYSRKGFQMFVDGETVPIGRNKIDRWFRTTYSASEIARMRASIDPERNLVVWALPNRLIIYNWELEKFTHVDVAGIVGVTTGSTSSLTLEDIAASYPSIEDVPLSFDDPFWRGGDPLLLVAMNDNKLHAFGASSALEAVWRMARLEPNSGRETHVRNSRVIGDMSAASVAIDCRARLGDAPVNVVSSDFRSNGEVPIRASGRFVQPQITIASGQGWNFVTGFELEASPGGRQ